MSYGSLELSEEKLTISEIFDKMCADKKKYESNIVSNITFMPNFIKISDSHFDTVCEI